MCVSGDEGWTCRRCEGRDTRGGATTARHPWQVGPRWQQALPNRCYHPRNAGNGPRTVLLTALVAALPTEAADVGWRSAFAGVLGRVEAAPDQARFCIPPTVVVPARVAGRAASGGESPAPSRFPRRQPRGYLRRVSKPSKAGRSRQSKQAVTATFQARGHLIDSGLMSDALEAVQAAGATYRVVKLDIGTNRLDESQLELEVTAPDAEVFERVRADLMSLGLSETETQDAVLAAVDIDGTAPDGFYSSTNLATEVRIDGEWLPVAGQRMDATLVFDGGAFRCVKLRDLVRGQRLVVGYTGIRVTPHTSRKLQQDGGRFGFMQGGASSERQLAAQVTEVVREWRRARGDGKKVVLVAGPVVVHVGAAPVLAAILRAGLVDGLLSGNALAVHDIEAALFGTSLGIEVATGRAAVHGHMHHMRAINTIRRAGSIENAVAQGILKGGVMHACVQAKVPFCLAGSIRDDGPLPDTQMDLIEAQEAYARILVNAGLVVILSSMLHGIGTGNMIPAEVRTVCVDIHPAVVGKLSDRGSAQSAGIVTDVGAFLGVLAQQLGVALPGPAAS